MPFGLLHIKNTLSVQKPRAEISGAQLKWASESVSLVVCNESSEPIHQRPPADKKKKSRTFCCWVITKLPQVIEKVWLSWKRKWSRTRATKWLFFFFSPSLLPCPQVSSVVWKNYWIVAGRWDGESTLGLFYLFCFFSCWLFCFLITLALLRRAALQPRQNHITVTKLISQVSRMFTVVQTCLRPTFHAVAQLPKRQKNNKKNPHL